MELREKIKALRKRVSPNQEDFADRLGVTQSTVSRWENGAIPDTEQLKGLAALAGQTVDAFLTDEGPEPQSIDPNNDAVATSPTINDSDVIIDDADAQALYDRAKRTVAKILRRVGITDADTINQVAAMHFHDLASGRD